MVYSSTAIMGILIQLIINHDILLKREKDSIPAADSYFRFLIATMVYYLTDAAWGILDMLHLTMLLYADTVIYYVAMASAVFLWTRYVIDYLEVRNVYTGILSYSGSIFFVFELISLAINFFYPVFFSFDAEGKYQAGTVRYTALIIQIIFFLLTSMYTFHTMSKANGAVMRRNRTIGLFGLVMSVFIFIQFFYPLLPLYSMGYILGTCLLHTFVIGDLKNEYRLELEEALKREKAQKKELGSARRMVNTDPLTGVKSKHAYMNRTEIIDELIEDGTVEPFAIAVFDLNDLKGINDSKGHETGDEYIKATCKLICDHFKHSPVYRIGGDEFAAVLLGADYTERFSIMEAFNSRIDKNLREGKAVVALGSSDFDRALDHDISSVFERADANMYIRKKQLKELQN